MDAYIREKGADGTIRPMRRAHARDWKNLKYIQKLKQSKTQSKYGDMDSPIRWIKDRPQKLTLKETYTYSSKTI